jgi:hypothetical protein
VAVSVTATPSAFIGRISGRYCRKSSFIPTGAIKPS